MSSTPAPPEPIPEIEAFKPYLAKIASGAPLAAAEAEAAFGLLMDGKVAAAQIGAFLMGLRVRGETVEEITAAAQAMRARMTPFRAPAAAVDTCGTGGDAKGSFNISTAAALVVAGCGLPVAKHGNRAQSSRSGSADVLAALGVNLEASTAVMEKALATVGIGFILAPRHHTAMAHVAPVRAALGTRTIFNLLGPLANPASARFQVVGVFDAAWVEPLARVLGALGARRAWVVHGRDGMDELTTTDASDIAEWHEGKLRRFRIAPEDLGLVRAAPASLDGGDAATNAEAIRALLNGEKNGDIQPFRDIVLLNAAAALVVAGQTAHLPAGLDRAARAIDSGAAAEALARLVAITNAS